MDLEKLSDDALVDLARNSSNKQREKAMEKLYSKHKNHVFYFLLRLSHNKEDAEDLVHDSFLKAFDNLNNYVPDKKNSFKRWINTIAYNRFIDFYRKKSRMPYHNCLDDMSKNLLNSIKSEESIELELSIKEKKRMIKEEIKKERKSYYLPFLLHYFYGKKQEEIAAYLNMKIGTVKANIFRATNSLIKKVELRRDLFMDY